MSCCVASLIKTFLVLVEVLCFTYNNVVRSYFFVLSSIEMMKILKKIGSAIRSFFIFTKKFSRRLQKTYKKASSDNTGARKLASGGKEAAFALEKVLGGVVVPRLSHGEIRLVVQPPDTSDQNLTFFPIFFCITIKDRESEKSDHFMTYNFSRRVQRGVARLLTPRVASERELNSHVIWGWIQPYSVNNIVLRVVQVDHLGYTSVLLR